MDKFKTKKGWCLISEDEIRLDSPFLARFKRTYEGSKLLLIQPSPASVPSKRETRYLRRLRVEDVVEVATSNRVAGVTRHSGRYSHSSPVDMIFRSTRRTFTVWSKSRKC